MAKLDDRVRMFIVRALACFDSPSEVARQVKEEFGLDMPRQQVANYDPTKATAKTLAPKWRDLFARERADFLANAQKVPIASGAYRLRRLQTMLDTASARNNHALAAQLLEQAAKEVGGVYTNRREVGGPGGGAIPVRNDGISTALLTDDELAQLEAIRAAADSRANSAGVGEAAA